MPERFWDFPIVTTLRERVRTRTPGEMPPTREVHPIARLFHDMQRFIRRAVFGGR